MKPHMHIVGISIFSLDSVHVQTYQNYEQPPQTTQNSDFRSHFSVLKIGRICPKNISVKDFTVGDQLLLVFL
jgi:hypothetical protein